MTTFLQATNDVLARLRESSVASVTTTTYSTLIGKFVNDAKRQVEDAFNWNALATTLSLFSTPATSTMVVTGSGLRARDVTINDTTNKAQLTNVPLQWITDQQQLASVSSGIPGYYAWNGNNGTDMKIELYPTPTGANAYKFNLTVPQATLSADADVILIPSDSIVMNAYARALVERGEDGGLSSSEAWLMYKGVLSDQIAHESGNFVENNAWVAV